MADGLKLSKKYGVNPTIPVCYWCGKEKNQINLMGKVLDKDKNEIEMPRKCVMDIEPCDDCMKARNEAWKKGAVIIYEMSRSPFSDYSDRKKAKYIHDVNRLSGLPVDVNYTGRMVGISKEAMRTLMENFNEETRQDIEFQMTSDTPKLMFTKDVFSAIFNNVLGGEEHEDTEGNT